MIVIARDIWRLRRALAEIMGRATDDLNALVRVLIMEAQAELIELDRAMLGEDAADLIYEPRPASHQALANPMEGLDRQLFGGLRRNKAHRGPADGLADSLCIIPIVFVRLHMHGDRSLM